MTSCCSCVTIEYMPNAKYCHECGGSIPLQCKKCKHYLMKLTAKFCDQCGECIRATTIHLPEYKKKKDVSTDEKLLQFLLKPIHNYENLNANEPFTLLMHLLFPEKELSFAGTFITEGGIEFRTVKQQQDQIMLWWPKKVDFDIDETIKLCAATTRHFKSKGLPAQVNLCFNSLAFFIFNRSLYEDPYRCMLRLESFEVQFHLLHVFTFFFCLDVIKN